MSKLRLTGIAVTATATLLMAAPWSPQDATASEPQIVDNFQLIDQNGFARELYRLQDAKAVVIAMHVAGNESSRRTAATLAALRKDYPAVEFMMVNSSLADQRQDIEADAKVAGITIPVLDDPTQLIGEALGAAHAGEVFVIDPKGWRVVYRGALDKKAAKKRASGYLADALAAVTSDRPVAVAEVQAKGDAIEFPERAKAESFASISYAETIAPMLEQKCVACHQEGGIGPFAMDSYEKVKGFAPMIREVLRMDRMPPWDRRSARRQVPGRQERCRPTRSRRWFTGSKPARRAATGPDPLAAVKHVARRMAARQAGPDRRHPELHDPGDRRRRLPASGRRRTR